MLFKITTIVSLGDDAGLDFGPCSCNGPTLFNEGRVVRRGREVGFGGQDLVP